MTELERCLAEQLRAVEYLRAHPNAPDAFGARLMIGDWLHEEILLRSESKQRPEQKLGEEKVQDQRSD
jgi:hypothetical protein